MLSKKDFSTMEQSLQDALNDLLILSGDIVGPSDVTWQDVAGTAMTNLRVVASILEDARQGGSFPVFPSPQECMDRVWLDATVNDA